MFIEWSDDKNKTLKETRGFGFEDVVIAINSGEILDNIPNPQEGFQHQRMIVVKIEDYAVVVPYVKTDNGIFLKTAYKSRKATKRYIEE